MLKQRVLTAMVLIPLALAAVFLTSPVWFNRLLILVSLYAAWEWSTLAGIQKPVSRLIYMLSFFLSLLLIGQIFFIQSILTVAVLFWVLALVLIYRYPAMTGWSKGIFWRGLLGFFVLIPCFLALKYIRFQETGLGDLFFLFILIWGADTTAYFVGKKYGKDKLMPMVSPGKSRQGFLGAMAFSVLAGLVLAICCGSSVMLSALFVLLSLATVFFSVAGDLFESMLKRQVGIKDSGRILPGHGGLLDRIDSLTAAAPIYAFGLWWLRQYIAGF